MARGPIRIEARGLAKAKALFTRIREFGADPTGLLEAWAALIEASTRNRFDSGKGPGGVPWPLSKRVIRDGGKTLVDKGNLESSIRNIVIPHGFEVGVDAIGESSRNAHVHQFGFAGPVQIPQHQRTMTMAFGVPMPEPKIVTVKAHTAQQNIPKREFLGIDADDKRDMKEVALEHLRELLQ